MKEILHYNKDMVCDYTNTTCEMCPASTCFYEPGEEINRDIEVCDYTGEQCFGNKLFCEECEVMRDEK